MKGIKAMTLLCVMCLCLTGCAPSLNSGSSPVESVVGEMDAGSLKEYQFTLDDEFYEMRVLYQDLKADGWYCTKVDEMEYEVSFLMQLTDIFTMEKEGVDGTFTFQLVNDTRTFLPIEECKLYFIEARAEDGGVPLVLPGGITFGMDLETVRSIIKQADKDHINTVHFTEILEEDGQTLFRFAVGAGAIFVRVDPDDGVVLMSVKYTYTGKR